MIAKVIEHEGKNVIQISPTPTKTIRDGLKLIPKEDNEDVVVLSADIKKGQALYDFPDSRVYKEILIIEKPKKTKK